MLKLLRIESTALSQGGRSHASVRSVGIDHGPLEAGLALLQPGVSGGGIDESGEGGGPPTAQGWRFDASGKGAVGGCPISMLVQTESGTDVVFAGMRREEEGGQVW